MSGATGQGMSWWTVLWRYSSFEAADSAWSLIVVSTYFGAYVQVVLHRPGAEFGWAVAAASLVVALASPVLGAAADESGRRQPYLRVAVAAVALFTAAIGWTETRWAALGCFMAAYIAANAALTCFTAMLPAVSNERTVYAITGMTVGLGYIGGLICLMLFAPLAATDAGAGAVFAPMAAAYVVFAVPAMFLSPDFPARAGRRLDLLAPYRRLHRTWSEAKRYRYLLRFLIGNFLYENAVASVITLMGLYARNVMGFSASELRSLFGPAIMVAAVSAWALFPPLTRSIGPKRAVLLVLGIWIALFVATILVRPETALIIGSTRLGAKALFALAVAPLAGLGLAGVWSTSRVLLIALSPVEKSGEFWGLYNLSGRTASVLGDVTWTLILTGLGEGILGYHVAAVALGAYVLAGAGFILSLPDARPSSDNFIARAASRAAQTSQRRS